MRYAKSIDAWRAVKNDKNYKTRVSKLIINDINRYTPGFTLHFTQCFNVICGRNGVGKTDLLRKIYSISNGDNSLGEVFVSSQNKNGSVDFRNISGEMVYYVEPSIECAKIINYLKSTTNIDELIEGVDESYHFADTKVLNILKQIVGKQYKKIQLYEIESAIDDNRTFPFIKVETESGVSYTCLEMGMGELLCFYVVWFFLWVDKESIILIEELENFLSARSQNELINYLAETSSKRGLWTILTSHSEYILNKFDKESLFLISQCRQGKTKAVSYSSEKQFKEALGIYFEEKGAVFFEDKFAMDFARSVFTNLHSPYLHSIGIFYVKNGESALEKIASHFQPVGNYNHVISCVFDADQSSKVIAANSHHVSVLALPSSSCSNPEEELWSIVRHNYDGLASRLNLDQDSLLEAIHNYGSADHHDRFTYIATSIGKHYDTLLDATVQTWLHEAGNLMLARYFIFAFSLRGRIFAEFSEFKETFLREFGDTVGTEIIDVYQHLQKFKVTFDGTKLVCHR